jgi:hypothetical protein
VSKKLRTSLGIVATAISMAALADKPITYPAKGQSAAQQQKDDGECYTWAKGNTGIDPAALAAAPPPAQPAPPPAPGGQRVGGAVKGAAVGAIVTDNSDGAKSGAVVGAMAGGARKREQQRANAQASQQQQAQGQQQQQQKMATYYKAYGACMEGRGYTVK